MEDEEEKRGYLLTKTPFMAKRELYKISGHWDHYRDGMFVMGDPDADGEVFALRPMTCPFQFQAYLNRTRSYRDLPLRYNETSTLFRNEASGEMHGLIRVRQFTISEGHLACTPEQVEEEFRGCVDLARFMLKAVGLDADVSYRFSKWDPNNREKYIGDPASWESTQDFMRKILDHLEIPYVEAEGEAAFYGPKLDIQIKQRARQGGHPDHRAGGLPTGGAVWHGLHRQGRRERSTRSSSIAHRSAATSARWRS